MKWYVYFIILIVIFTYFCIVSASAQDKLRAELFTDADKIMNEAREKEAPLYSPTNFERGLKYYTEADEYFTRGEKLEDIRDKIKNSIAYLVKAIELCKPAEVTFSATMAARSDAQRAGAWKYSRKLWDTAEEQFRKAAAELEESDLKNAREKSREAETNYRSAELEAIKSNYLSPARELLKKAEEMDAEDNAPKTLEYARKLTARVEDILKQNRYDTDEARQLAEDAKYEAAHAIFLHQEIAKLKEDKKTPEEIIHLKESKFQRVAVALGVNARFDNGFEPLTADLISAIKEKDSKISRDKDSMRQADEIIKVKNEEIENLKMQVDMMSKRLGTLSEAETRLQETGRELKRKLDLQYEQEATIRRVAAMFGEEEGNVLRDGDKIIIRLYGLTFPVGKYTIEPHYYPLLKRVQDAIRKFPHSRVTVEGHTDSQGGDDINQSLSERRANAVAEYFMANMNVEFPVNSEGFGESRPIASNDTPDGRAKNRRIDILITPESREGEK